MRWLLEASHGGADRRLAHVMVVGVMERDGWWVSVGHVAVGWCGAVEEAWCDGSSAGGEDDGRRPKVAGLVSAGEEMVDGGKAGRRRAGVCGAARWR
ncbi:hypothetical protein ACLOJK_029270 [Asimina triloba]